MLKIEFANGLLMAITVPASAVGLPMTWGNAYRVGNQTSTKAEIMVTDRSQAVEARREWMQLMGYSPEEITEACEETIIDLQEEQEQLYYARKLKDITPRRDVLEGWSTKY